MAEADRILEAFHRTQADPVRPEELIVQLGSLAGQVDKGEVASAGGIMINGLNALIAITEAVKAHDPTTVSSVLDELCELSPETVGATKSLIEAADLVASANTNRQRLLAAQILEYEKD